MTFAILLHDSGVKNSSSKALSEADAICARCRAAWKAISAAREDVNAAQRAFDLAKKRRDDAVTQRDQYSASSSAQIWAQAASQAQGMGEDSWYGEISELAHQ